jgi:hypothetical protein
LADELASLSYWLIQDSQKKGFFTLKEVVPLLNALRFDTTEMSLNSFKKEFRFLLQQNPGEIFSPNEEDVVIRFDLVR